MKISALPLVFCSLLSTAAIANDKGEAIVDLAVPFAAQAQQVRADLAGETYGEITQDDKRKVNAALQRLDAALADGADINSLNEAEKVQVFNDQELINTVLMKARADSRVVCKREKTVGSHRAVSQCLTVAERRRLREESFELLQANQRDLSKPNAD
ncbi:hypothetical protein D3C81_916480 [compost metagenome]